MNKMKDYSGEKLKRESERERERKERKKRFSSPLLRVAELFISPEMKEDSVCFLTVSFHIRRIRL